MASTYFDPGHARSERVHDLFSNIARRYDLLNDLQSFGLHRRWKSRLVQMAQTSPGERALDLCCGTGDVALRLARQGVNVVALDFSEPMLIRAQSRKAAIATLEGLQRNALEFCRGDAQKVPFPDACFDIVTVAYGLRNLASWEIGLEEMWRVTRPGGRVLVMDFGKPSHRLWRGIYFAYLRGAVPVLGKVFCGDAQAYAYILDSLRHYPAQSGVAEKLAALSGQPVRECNLLGGAMSIHCAWKKQG